MKNIKQDKTLDSYMSENEDLISVFKISRRVAEDIAGCMDDAGRRELEEWLKESRSNQAVYQEIKESIMKGQVRWPYSGKQVEEQLMKFYRRRAGSTRRFSVWWRYAAILILLLGIAGVLRWQMTEKKEIRRVEAVQMARGNTVLILSTGEKVMLLDTVRSVREEPAVDIREPGQMISYKNEDKPVRTKAYNVLVVPRGGEFKVELADGTKVWLNAQSELRYPVQFGEGQRVVYLKGEGYFEVASNAGKPFVVKTSSDVDIKVLGTTFNISSYENDADVTTTLAEGSVEVIMPGKAIRISPNEQLIFNKKELSSELRKVTDASVYSAWKDGNFIFEDQRLEQIMEQLKRWYEIEVFYAGEGVKDYRFTGDLRKYDNFEKIVKMIEEVAGVKMNINGKSIVIGTK